jgi:hypothetical protein
MAIFLTLPPAFMPMRHRSACFTLRGSGTRHQTESMASRSCLARSAKTSTGAVQALISRGGRRKRLCLLRAGAAAARPSSPPPRPCARSFVGASLGGTSHRRVHGFARSARLQSSMARQFASPFSSCEARRRTSPCSDSHPALCACSWSGGALCAGAINTAPVAFFLRHVSLLC